MLSGKGMYLWKVTYCEGGDAVRIAEQAKAAGLAYVLFKIANGVYNYNVSADLHGLVRELHRAGLQAWGWHYVLGDDPAGEAGTAALRVKELGLDGYTIDAESEYKEKPGQAHAFMLRMRLALGGLPVALSSYRYPYLHPEFPWAEFLEGVDLNMPQVYWMQAHNPAEQLRESVRQFNRLYAGLGLCKPIVPTGAAFREHGWQSTPAEVNEFMRAAVDLQLPGYNFWEWWFARERLPDLWPVISAFRPSQDKPPSTVFVTRRANCIKDVLIRTSPNTRASTWGKLYSGVLVDVMEEAVMGNDVWVRYGFNQWSARRYQGTTFLEYLQ